MTTTCTHYVWGPCHLSSWNSGSRQPGGFMSPSSQVRGPGVPWAALRMQEATSLLCLGCWGSRSVGCAGRPGPGRGLAAADPRPSHLNTRLLWSLALAQPLLPRWSWVLMRTLPSLPALVRGVQGLQAPQKAWSLRRRLEGGSLSQSLGPGLCLPPALMPYQ